MYDVISKKVNKMFLQFQMDEVFERTKKQNELDHDRMLKDFERESTVEKKRKKQVKSQIQNQEKKNQQNVLDWENKAQDMKRIREVNASKQRKEVLNKIEKRESSVLTTLSNIHTSYGKNSDVYNSKIDYVKNLIYQKTEVLIK